MKAGEDLGSPGVSHFRIAFVGDPCSGKSEVRRAYVQLSTAKESIEQVDSNVARVKGFLVELLTVDRESEFEKIPHMSRCSHLDAVILFYDISNPTQFERTHNQWIPLIKRLYQGTPFVICATGIEARIDKVERELALHAQIDVIKRHFADVDDNSPGSSSDDSVDTSTATSSTTTTARSTLSKVNLNSDGEKSPSGGGARHGSSESVPTSPTVLKRICLSPTRVPLNASSKSGFRKLVPTQLGKYLAFHCGASAFKEVSYRTFEGVQDLLEETVTHVVKADKVKFSLVRSRVGLPLPRHTYRLS